MKGLGDLVAFVLEPLQSVLGRFGVRTKDCGCQKRKTFLNRLFPFRTKATKPTNISRKITSNEGKSLLKMVKVHKKDT